MPQPIQPADSDATAALKTPPDGSPKARGRRRRGLRITLIVLLVVALLAGVGVAGTALYLHSVESGIERVDAFNDVPKESRPEKVAESAANLLILGSDSRDPGNTDGSRSDSIILAHLSEGRTSAQLISIPRDTWVHVPSTKDGRQGNRDAKINAAFAWGGYPLMVQTVENFTGVRIDHLVVIDFAGFQRIVDALGGIEIEVDQNFKSIHEPYRSFTKGMTHMDGATALDYSRQRQQFANGDFTRIQHQQQVIKAILDKAASGGMLTDPGKLNSFLKATADAVSVDKTLNILNTGMELRHLQSSNLTFYTSPTKGTGQVGTESVVFADTAKAKAFYDAVRRDATAEMASAAQK